MYKIDDNNLFSNRLKHTVIILKCLEEGTQYRLETEAKGSTRYRNPRGSHIEHERVARGFYGDARVSIPRRSRWPRSLTGLEYSNRCYPTRNFRRCANVCEEHGHTTAMGKHRRV